MRPWIAALSGVAALIFCLTQIPAAGAVPTPVPTKKPSATPTRKPTPTPTKKPVPTPTAIVRHTTIEAASFNFIAGTPDYSNDGLVEGASSMPVATGVANVALGDGAVVTAFTICGRDFASDQEFAGFLKRKTINPANSAFTPPQIMAQVHSGIAGASNNMICLKSPIATGTAVIDNSNFTYYVEIDVGDTVEVIAARIDH
jgi:hypothetical protein